MLSRLSEGIRSRPSLKKSGDMKSGHGMESQKWKQYVNDSLNFRKGHEEFAVAILQLEIPLEATGFSKFKHLLQYLDIRVKDEYARMKPRYEIIVKPPNQSILKIGDEVVWLQHDNKHQDKGRVQWLAKIKSIMCAGVEFERQIGFPCDALGKNFIFPSKPGHARIVPLMELIQVGGENFYRQQKHYEATPDWNPKRRKNQDLDDTAVTTPLQNFPSAFVRVDTSRQSKIPNLVVKPSQKSSLNNSLNQESNGIQVGNRIICSLNGRLEQGILKFHEVLNDQDMAGIEFDNPVAGNGRKSDKSDSTKYFRCKPGHGVLVPFKSLMALGNSVESESQSVSVIKNYMLGNFQPLHSEQLSRNSGHVCTDPASNSSIIINLNPGDRVIKYIHGVPEFGTVRIVLSKKDEGKTVVGVDLDSNRYLLCDASELVLENREILNQHMKGRTDFKIPLLHKIAESQFSSGNDSTVVVFGDGNSMDTEEQQLNTRSGLVQRNNINADYSTVLTYPVREESLSAEPEYPQMLQVVIPVCSSSLSAAIGFGRGIQGGNNSGYVDSVLFSFFYCTDIFDSRLLRNERFFRRKYQKNKENIRGGEIMHILREKIVNPLRKNGFVRHENTKEFRMELIKLNSRFTTAPMDSEVLFVALFQHFLKLKEFLTYSNGVSDFLHQIIYDPNEHPKVTSVQQLIEKSFLLQDSVKFTGVPCPALIISLPRANSTFPSQVIIPSLCLDITDLMANAARSCIICGRLATRECSACYDKLFGPNSGMRATSYCLPCGILAHSEKSRINHYEKISEIKSTGSTRRIRMELLAVICYKASRYTTYIKCGIGASAPWVFFSSISYKDLPEVLELPRHFGTVLARADADKTLNILRENWGLVPEQARQILTDGYIYIYYSPEAVQKEKAEDESEDLRIAMETIV